eukprot:11445804-Prorocentrum_lima.AAC.1
MAPPPPPGPLPQAQRNLVPDSVGDGTGLGPAAPAAVDEEEEADAIRRNHKTYRDNIQRAGVP